MTSVTDANAILQASIDSNRKRLDLLDETIQRKMANVVGGTANRGRQYAINVGQQWSKTYDMKAGRTSQLNIFGRNKPKEDTIFRTVTMGKKRTPHLIALVGHGLRLRKGGFNPIYWDATDSILKSRVINKNGVEAYRRLAGYSMSVGGKRVKSATLRSFPMNLYENDVTVTPGKSGRKKPYTRPGTHIMRNILPPYIQAILDQKARDFYEGLEKI